MSTSNESIDIFLCDWSLSFHAEANQSSVTTQHRTSPIAHMQNKCFFCLFLCDTSLFQCSLVVAHYTNTCTASGEAPNQVMYNPSSEWGTNNFWEGGHWHYTRRHRLQRMDTPPCGVPLVETTTLPELHHGAHSHTSRHASIIGLRPKYLHVTLQDNISKVLLLLEHEGSGSIDNPSCYDGSPQQDSDRIQERHGDDRSPSHIPHKDNHPALPSCEQ